MSNFFKCLNKSLSTEIDEKVENILKKEIGVGITAKNLTTKNDLGTDYTHTYNNKTYNIDIKVRRTRNKYNDICLEVMSNIELGRKGWLDQEKKTDYLLWLWEGDTHYMVSYKDLKMIWNIYKRDWIMKYHTFKQMTDTGNHYHSSCIFVPIPIVEETIDLEKWWSTHEH